MWKPSGSDYQFNADDSNLTELLISGLTSYLHSNLPSLKFDWSSNWIRLRVSYFAFHCRLTVVRSRRLDHPCRSWVDCERRARSIANVEVEVQG